MMIAVARAFEAVAKAFIGQWTCCMEQYTDPDVHCHVCDLLRNLQPRDMVKWYLKDFEHVIIIFSSHSRFYREYQ